MEGGKRSGRQGRRLPWATMLIVSPANVGAAIRRRNDWMYSARRLVVRHERPRVEPIDNHVYGFTLQKLNFPF